MRVCVCVFSGYPEFPSCGSSGSCVVDKEIVEVRTSHSSMMSGSLEK